MPRRAAGRGARERQHARFGQELSDDSEPVGAKSRAHGHLATPRLAERQHQIRHVGARHEKNERHRGEQDGQYRTGIPEAILPQRPYDDAEVALVVLVGRVVGQPRDDAVHLGRCGIDCCAGVQPGKGRQVMTAATVAGSRAIERERKHRIYGRGRADFERQYGAGVRYADNVNPLNP